MSGAGAAAPPRSPVFATYHGYRAPAADGARIDWVLVRGVAAVASATIHTFAKDGQYPSDHFPVSARVRLGPR